MTPKKTPAPGLHSLKAGQRRTGDARHDAVTASDYSTITLPGIDHICPRCGVIDRPAIAPGNGPHAFRASCRHCGAFIRWVSQYSPAERQARRDQARQQAMAQRPPSQRQLAYLAALGDDGPPPASMAEASEAISAMIRARQEGTR